MSEIRGKITMKGHPLTLLGNPVEIGEMAPEFTVTNSNLEDVKLSDYKGKTIILSVFPSIDTPVCANQTRHFNKKAVELGNDVVVLAISKDLPFALNRFCAAEGIDRVHALSDYKSSDFGLKYGFLIKELMLLSRGVIVIDKRGKLVYAEYVSEITNEPDYKAALEAVRKHMGK